MKPITPVISGKMHMSKKFKEELAAAQRPEVFSAEPSAAHMPGPLSIAVEIFDNEGMPETAIQNHDGSATVAVALDFGANNPGMRSANARRLVACWNACEWLGTEFIEHVGQQRLANKLIEYSELVRQRDALKARVLELESRPPARPYLPGPWFHIGQGDIICGQAPDTHDVATVYLREDGTMEANAALIIAAPDLLDALKDLLMDYGSISLDFRLMDKAHAAITKATTINNR